MAERNDLVTFKGNPLTLNNTPLKVGDSAPDFAVNVTLGKDVTLAESAGKVRILTGAPSIDTGVCQVQLRAFNERVAELGDDVEVWYITRDLPFALQRFCAADGIDNVKVLSDYKDHEFGQKFGVVMQEFALIARSTFVVDRSGTIVYAEVVPEMVDEPNYDAALAAASSAR